MCEFGDGQGPFVVFNALEAAVVGAPARSQGFGGEAIITFPARKKFSLDTVWCWSLARRYLAIRLSGAQPVAIFSSRVGLPVAARWLRICATEAGVYRPSRRIELTINLNGRCSENEDSNDVLRRVVERRGEDRFGDGPRVRESWRVTGMAGTSWARSVMHLSNNGGRGGWGRSHSTECRGGGQVTRRLVLGGWQ